MLSLATAVQTHGSEWLAKALDRYYQEDFVASMEHLDSLAAQEGLSNRDSLALEQYYGMIASRLGDSAKAVMHFTRLLELDSNWQFPMNEDDVILRHFSVAGKQRATTPDSSVSELTSAPDTASNEAEPPPAPAAGAVQSPPDLLPAPGFTARSANLPRMSFQYGVLPLGTGWYIRGRKGTGLTLGILQGVGLMASFYASSRHSRLVSDGYIPHEELEDVNNWQLVQQASLGVVIGSYLISVFSSLEGK